MASVVGRFEVIGAILNVEVIARGAGLRNRRRLQKAYGPGRWRKMKGLAKIRVDQIPVLAELHWYEAHGVGRCEFKVKRILK